MSYWKLARRLVVFVIGTTVVLFGTILLFVPGPAFVVIPAGLAILATEFVWARRLLKEVKNRVVEMGQSVMRQKNHREPAPATDQAGHTSAEANGRTDAAGEEKHD